MDLKVWIDLYLFGQTPQTPNQQIAYDGNYSQIYAQINKLRGQFKLSLIIS